MDVKLATENIRTIALFEKITHVHAKDCILTEHSLYFLVNEDKMGMAIGKSGAHIKELRHITGKNIKIFAFSPDLQMFLRNLIPNARSIEVEGKNVTVTVPREDKTTLIGRSGENINTVRDILKRHFGVESFKLR